MPISYYIIAIVFIFFGAGFGTLLLCSFLNHDDDDKAVVIFIGVAALLAFISWTYRKDVYIWYSAEPGMDISGRDFSRVDFRNTCLIDANLERAVLTGANFQYVQLNNASMEGANLTGANLIGATLFGADLRGADLSHTNMEAIDLREADLTGAKMHGANVKHAWLWGARGANLGGTYGKPRDELDALHPELRKQR